MDFRLLLWRPISWSLSLGKDHRGGKAIGVRGNDLAADACGVIIVLIVVLIVIGIILKFISWGSGVAANIGTYRQGKAVKKISYDGLKLQHSQTGGPGYPQSFQQGYFGASGQQILCQYCGASWVAGRTSCVACGRSPPQVEAMPRARPHIERKLRADGTKYCRHCGQVVPNDSTFCEHCGNKL